MESARRVSLPDPERIPLVAIAASLSATTFVNSLTTSGYLLHSVGMSDTFEIWFARFRQYDLVSSPVDAHVRCARRCDVDIDGYKQSTAETWQPWYHASRREIQRKQAQRNSIDCIQKVVSSREAVENNSMSLIKAPVTRQMRLLIRIRNMITYLWKDGAWRPHGLGP